MNPEDTRVLSPATEWTPPEKVAQRYDEWMRGDGPGVYKDHVIDLRIDTENYLHQLRRAHIAFDIILDGQVVPPFIASEIAVMDRHLRDMITWLEDFKAEVEGFSYE